jgi:hypothetical protein
MNVHAERLLNVARALREAPDNGNFTMEFYCWSGKEFDCGTPACAIGHYAARQDLQRLFFIDEHGALMVHYPNGDWNIIVSSDPYNPSVPLQHFGITHEEWGELFYIDGCGNAATAIEAAEYIEQFVAKKFGEVVLDVAA